MFDYQGKGEEELLNDLAELQANRAMVKEFKESNSDYVPNDAEGDSEISSDGEFLAEQFKFEEDDPKAA